MVTTSALADGGVGSGTDITTSSITLPDGKTLFTSQSKQHLLSDEVPIMNNVLHDCSVVYVIEEDFSAGVGAGSCAGLDTDGDVYWQRFEGDFAGGKWEIFSGTGKFADYKVGGTYTVNAGFVDFSRFSYSWEIDDKFAGM
jgi:hypothetical protein